MNNLPDYDLLKNKTTNSTLNYNYSEYNNYNSWSNYGVNNITMSIIDQYGNIETSNHDYTKLPRLNDPFATFGNVKKSWVNEKN
mgnify:CR=1 FL=1